MQAEKNISRRVNTASQEVSATTRGANTASQEVSATTRGANATTRGVNTTIRGVNTTTRGVNTTIRGVNATFPKPAISIKNSPRRIIPLYCGAKIYLMRLSLQKLPMCQIPICRKVGLANSFSIGIKTNIQRDKLIPICHGKRT